VDLEHLLISLYCLIDDWRKAKQTFPPARPGRPAQLSDAEVLTLAILAQWSRWRSERDFWRFADTHLRTYFPELLSQSQLNRRVRTLEPELRDLQRDLAEELLEPSEVYFGRSVSKTEWVYGFKVALSVSPTGVITAFGLAPANCDERPIGDFLVGCDGHDGYLADKGFSSVDWERH
jgi:hypothetical protein